MTATSRAMRSLERHILAVLFTRQLLLWLAAWCVAWGVLTLIGRIAFDVPRSQAAIGIATLPLIVLAAALHARRLRPSGRQLAALVDAHARAGGLVMASTETDLGAWSAEVRDAPRVRWNGRREVALAILSTAFAVGVLLVPARDAEARRTLAIGKDVERLQDRVDVLREEEILEEAQAEVMTKTLEALRQEASGDDPAKAWEALDSIDEATMRAAKEAAESAVEKGQQLTKVEAMAFALDENAVADPTAGMRDLAEAAKKDETLANVDEATQKALAKASLTKEQLQQIANAAKAGKEQLRQTLQKLRDRGLIDPKTLAQFEDAANFADRQGLAKFLKENSDIKLGTAVGEFQRGMPGVGRGRADAPMFFGEKAKEDAQFKEQTLPPAAAAALAQSQVVAVSAATPGAQEGTRSAGGALTNAKSDGGSAFTAEVLPRHRGTVQRFFERKP
jgi:hypothetical protein